MTDYTTPTAMRYLPQVAVATTVVALLPVALVWWLHAAGIVTSKLLCIVLALMLSLAASLLGNAYWKRRAGPGDLLFSELLLWGWLRRVHVERQLSGAVDGLGLREQQHPDREGGDGREEKSELLRQLAFALDEQDPYTQGHSRRVAAHAVMIARRMGLSKDQVAKVRAAATVHDIGKLTVSRELLDKPARLTPGEFEIVKGHAAEGARIVSCLDDPELSSFVRHHHERFDGAGYPDGLPREEIPLGARIIAVADTFDALTSVRPYRLASSHKRAIDVLVRNSGTQLDPAAVRAFQRCYSGKRAVLFWTLLVAYPRTAAPWLRGKAPNPANPSLGPTMAGVAALTAIAAGSSPTSVPAGPTPIAVQDAPAISTPGLAAPRRRSVIRAARRHSSGSPLTAGSRRSATASHRFVVAPHVSARHRLQPRAAPTRHAGAGTASPHSVGRVSAPKPKQPGADARPSPHPGGHRHPGPHQGGPPPTPTRPPPPPPPGPPPPGPSKDQCKNGGYVKFGFRNQGQCVSSVENHSH